MSVEWIHRSRRIASCGQGDLSPQGKSDTLKNCGKFCVERIRAKQTENVRPTLIQPITSYIMHTRRSLRPAFLAISAVALVGAPTLHAATYQWNGTSTSAWTTAGNWAPIGTFFGVAVTAVGPGPTGGTFAHRLNITNGAGSPLIYDATLGTTVYANAAAGLRGLVMSSGTAAPNSSLPSRAGRFPRSGRARQTSSVIPRPAALPPS